MPDRELVASVAIIREEIAASAKDRRWMKRAMRFMMVAGAILLAIVCVLIYVVWTQSDDNQQKVNSQGTEVQKQKVESAVSRRRSRVAEQNSEKAPTAAARRVVQFLQGQRGIPGVRGADGKSGSPGPRGLTGKTGARGVPGATGATGAQGPPPTPAQITQAARDACAAGLCDSISSQELAAEVASQLGPLVTSALNSYCAAHNECRGEKGEKGDTGAQGADSTVPGPQGAQGETGPAGPAGADSTVPGPPGPATPCNPATINTVDGPVTVCVP